MTNARHISPTQLGMLSGTGCCPWKWHARYEAKLEGTKGEALLIGKHFDGLIGCHLLGQEPKCDSGLDADTLNLISKRFDEYQPHIPMGKPQVRIIIPLDYNDWVVKGFIDIVESGAGMYKSANFYSISERWRQFGTDDYKKPKPRSRIPINKGFQKGNRFGRNCREEKKSTVTAQHSSTVADQHG